MSGHSKWSTIKRKKEKADTERGKLFTKFIREITMATRQGGGDESANPRLRTAIAAAKAANMPHANVEKAIKKGTGELPGVVYEEKTYEGYGPGGVAIMIDALTDNTNRTTSEVRHILSKYQGNMG
ncbi:MAG: YebC/PmpR family DNA-binding transcriptional regulator, partial [bacterium]